MRDTKLQFEQALSMCRDIFQKKLHDYGASWRIMRPASITDQIFIKAKRIRTLETIGNSMVDEGILPEFMAIVNYGLIGVIQTKLGVADDADMDHRLAMEAYDNEALITKQLMLSKNHDYGEAWRSMRVTSYTDLILTKVARTKQIENNGGMTIISEGVDANYRDMVNYAIFAIIKLTDNESC